jgi:hypothetical protein
VIVDVGIACNKNQPHQWWAGVMGELLRVQERAVVEIGSLLPVGAATPDWVRNRVTELFIRPDVTAENRNVIAAKSDADAIWWLDDDTVPPSGALEALLERRVEIAAGVYYRRSVPYNPMVYKRMPNGSYVPLWDWQPGEILEADAVGMGCTVVRREAYERIREGHVSGTLVAVQQEAVIPGAPMGAWVQSIGGDHVVVVEGRPFHVQELTPVVDEDVEWWPYYMMEYQRTEDLYFCELAQAVGCRIVVDTAIECDHWGLSPVTGEDCDGYETGCAGVAGPAGFLDV